MTFRIPQIWNISVFVLNIFHALISYLTSYLILKSSKQILSKISKLFLTLPMVELISGLFDSKLTALPLYHRTVCQIKNLEKLNVFLKCLTLDLNCYVRVWEFSTPDLHTMRACVLVVVYLLNLQKLYDILNWRNFLPHFYIIIREGHFLYFPLFCIFFTLYFFT